MTNESQYIIEGLLTQEPDVLINDDINTSTDQEEINNYQSQTKSTVPYQNVGDNNLIPVVECNHSPILFENSQSFDCEFSDDNSEGYQSANSSYNSFDTATDLCSCDKIKDLKEPCCIECYNKVING